MGCKNTIIPNGVTGIDDFAFYGCIGLKSIIIPNSVTRIGNQAFYSCTNLTNITMPNSVTSIGADAFENTGYYNNKSNWENGVLYIGKYLVASNENTVPNRVTIKNGTVLVADWAFYGCYSLESIIIPSSVTSLNSIKYNGTITQWKQINVGSENDELQNLPINCTDGKLCLSHSWNSGKVTKAATCTAAGTKTYTCTKCKATKKETIKATGHTYKTTVTQATTSKNGSSVTKCTKCGTVSKKSTIAYPKTVTLSATSYTYDGKAKKPTVTVKDNAGKTIAASNYTLAYSNNTNVGTATVKVTFKGNYSGSISKTFKINPKNTSISGVSALYKGFTVKYAKQAAQTTGYQVQYSTSSNFSGAKTVTVNKNTTAVKNVTGLTAKKKYYVRIRTYKTVGKTNYYSAWSGAKNVTTSSYPTSIALSSTSYTYDGKVKKPSVTVKHGSTKIASKYYTVSYSSGRKNVGTYTVTIKFKKPYSGTVKKTFKINPKNTSISGLTAQSKAFTVKLKKYTTQTTGYQIQYSTSSNFSNAKTVTIKNTTTSKKVTGLTGNKKYYVRIRTYKTVGKTNYYSGWSGAKTITTKK